MNIGQAKQIDLVEYLASLGYNPAKIKTKSTGICLRCGKKGQLLLKLIAGRTSGMIMALAKAAR